MAKNNSLTKVTEGHYKPWKDLHKINKKDDFKTMMQIRNYYERSRNALRTSCYWDAYQQDTSGATFSGGSWYERWNLQEKMRLMWYKKMGEDDFISNIKSPMARGRINTFVNQMKRVNIEFGAKPNNKDDRNAAIVADKTTNYWMRNSNAVEAMNEAWEAAATHGTAFTRLFYAKEFKDYRFPKIKDLSKEEKREVKDGERKVVYGAPEKTLVTDDIVLEHIPIQEIFPDPQARNLHGDTYRAGWIIRKRYVTMDFVKSVYGNHPNVKYLDKVKAASSYRDITEYFFEPPKDNQGDDIVELLEMEDQDNDRFYVIANDIPIIGYGDSEPLPYNHKEVSYHKIDFIKIPGQFYSIGICDLLENIQGSYEVALNMVADYVYRTYNYKLLVDSENYGEIQQALQRTDDEFIPIDASDGKPVTSKVMPLQVSPISFDIFSFLDLLEKNATLATNIDPTQMALLNESKTATSDILNKELLMTMVSGVIDNNVNGDLKSLGRQLWKLQQQYYTKPRVKKIIGDDKKEVETSRILRFEGMKLELNDKTKLLEEKEVEEGYTFFELTDKYLSTKNELDIFIKPESVEIQSQALDEKRISEEFAQLAPFMVDPNNVQQVMTHEMPMIDANKLFREYFETKKLPEDLLINQNKEDSLSKKLAEQHMTKILKGERADAMPGQTSNHLEYEYQVLDALYYQLEQKDKLMGEDLERQTKEIMKEMENMPPINEFGEPIEMREPQPDLNLKNDIDKLQEVIGKVEEHLTIESMPSSMKNSRILMIKGGSAPPGQGMIPPEVPMPQGANINQITPDMINSINPGGEVPMGAPVEAPGNVNPGQII